MIEVYKLTHNGYDNQVSDILAMHTDYVEGRESLRGHKFKLYARRSRLNTRKKFFTFRVVTNWNQLPAKVVSAPSLHSFERRLDKHWQKYEIMYDFDKLVHNLDKVHLIGQTGVQDYEDLDI
jgi:hypothetical protein